MTTHTHSDLSGDEIPNYTEPVRFVWQGSCYEIDLTEAEAVELVAAEKDMDAWAAHARLSTSATIVAAGAERTGGDAESKETAPAKPKRVRKAAAKKTTTPRKTAKPAPKFDPPAEDLALPDEPASNGNGKTAPKPSDVRAWAVANGFKATGRGRLPKDINDAYAAAH